MMSVPPSIRWGSARRFSARFPWTNSDWNGSSRLRLWRTPSMTVRRPSWNDPSPKRGKRSGRTPAAYARLMQPLVPDDWDTVCAALRRNPERCSATPFSLARFGLRAIRSSRGLTDDAFQGGRARALFSGLAAHSFLPLEQSPSGAFGLALAITAHAVGLADPARRVAGHRRCAY